MKDSQIGTTPTHPNNIIPADKRDIIVNSLNSYYGYKLLDEERGTWLSKLECYQQLLIEYENNPDRGHVDPNISNEDMIRVLKEEIVFLQLQEGS